MKTILSDKLTKTCDDETFLSLNKELIETGNSVRFRVRGESMHPFLRNNDLVEVTGVHVSRIRVGDVIFFKNISGKAVIHRVVVVNRNKDILLLKGDHNHYLDAPVKREQILGRVIAVKTKNRTIRLDTTFSHFKNFFLAKLLLMGRWFLPFLKKTKKVTFRIYRFKETFFSIFGR